MQLDQLDQRKQQFMANKLTRNIMAHNSSSDTFWKLRDWILDNDELKITWDDQRVSVLEYLRIGRCRAWGCNTLYDKWDTWTGCDGCKERTKIKKQQEQLKKLMKKSRCKDENICCSICIENIETNTHQIKLKCSHRFHPDCITQWTNRKTSCPYCRKDIIPPVVSH